MLYLQYRLANRESRKPHGNVVGTCVILYINIGLGWVRHETLRRYCSFSGKSDVGSSRTVPGSTVTFNGLSVLKVT